MTTQQGGHYLQVFQKSQPVKCDVKIILGETNLLQSS